MLLVTITALFFAYQDRQTLYIEPIDFHDKGVEEAFPSNVRQLESVGEKIFLRCKKDPYVTIMERSGRILGKIGTQGFGPGEIDRGILAMAVYEDHLWLQGANQIGHLNHYVQGQFAGSVPIESVNISVHSRNSNAFAATPEAIVFPASPRTGHLAKVLTKGGEDKFLGELYFDRRDIDLLRKVPGMNDTNWVFDGQHYYCAFRFFPLVLKFNGDFKQIGAYPIDLPYVQDVFSRWVTDWEPGAKIKSPQPVFYDLKTKFGDVFLMTQMALVRMDGGTGDVSNLYRFQGKGPDFALPGEYLNLRHFTILDDGTLILAGIFKWNHDLWKVKLPPS